MSSFGLGVPVKVQYTILGWRTRSRLHTILSEVCDGEVRRRGREPGDGVWRLLEPIESVVRCAGDVAIFDDDEGSSQGLGLATSVVEVLRIAQQEYVLTLRHQTEILINIGIYLKSEDIR